MKGTPLGKSYGRRGRALAGATVAAGALTFGAAAADAKDSLLVTNTRAGGGGSFAAAIKTTSAKKTLDTIRFEKDLRGSIRIKKEVKVPSGVRIIGNGYGRGKREGRVALEGPDRGANLIFTSGKLHKLDDVYLDRVAVEEVSKVGRLEVVSSTISGDGSAAGTGVFMAPGDSYSDNPELKIDETTIEGFWSGVVAVDTGARISRSIIQDNIGGGGVNAAAYSFIEVYNSTISGNELDVSDGYPFGGAGVRGGYYAGAALHNTTVTGNSVVGEGGYGGAVAYHVEVFESTLTGNSAPTGGAIGTPPPEIVFPAIAGAGDVTISNSIVAGNTATDPGGLPDCSDPTGVHFLSRGGNLFGDAGNCKTKAEADLTGVDPLLGPLKDNGGPTPTMAIGKGSPAIGFAVKELATERDQRGVKRGKDPDSGAYERR